MSKGSRQQFATPGHRQNKFVPNINIKNTSCDWAHAGRAPAYEEVFCHYLIFFRSRLGRWLPAAIGSASAAASSSPSTASPLAAAASSSSGFWPSSLHQQNQIPNQCGQMTAGVWSDCMDGIFGSAHLQ